MDITPEDSLEPDPATQLQEGHALLIGAPGRGKTVVLRPSLASDEANQEIPFGVGEDGPFLPWLPGTPPLQHAAIFMSPEPLDELRNSRESFTFRVHAEPGGGMTAGLAAARNHRDPQHTKES